MLLEDYGLIGDLQSAALVGPQRLGRLAVPAALRLRRRASRPCSATSGTGAGCWRRPARSGRRRAATGPARSCSRPTSRPRDGAVRVIDFMPRRGDGPPRVMRIVEGLRGRVPMRHGALAAPGLRVDHALGRAAADGDRGHRRPGRVPAEHAAAAAGRGRLGHARSSSSVEGARERLTLTWHLSYEQTPPVEDADSALARTEAWWREWSGRCEYEGAYRDAGADVADRAQGDDLRDDGRADRGTDDVAARGHRRRAQLGLPLLLAARLGPRARGAARRRLHGRGAGLPRLPAARRRPATRERSRSCTGSAASGA